MFARAPGLKRMDENSLVERARKFATEAHDGQKRANGVPYMTHPEAVVEILREHGIHDETVLAAAYLHDVLEDTDVTSEQLVRAFGEDIARLVEELTNPHAKGSSFEEKNESLRDLARRMSGRAKLVKIADRIHNLSSKKPTWSVAKQQRYITATIGLLMALQPVPTEGASLEHRLRDMVTELLAT